MLDNVVDLDSHEGIPFHLWDEHFEGLRERWAPLLIQEPGKVNWIATQVVAKDESMRDNQDIDPATVWTVKGAGSPGSIDMNRRLDVMDAMGITKQLVFPGMGLFGMFFALTDPVYAKLFMGQDIPEDCDLAQLGRDSVTAHNDWVMRTMRSQHADSPRIRPTAILLMDEFDSTMAELERVVAGGVRALFIRSSAPPFGWAPADRRSDPLWQFCQDHDVAVTLHVGGDTGFLNSAVWCNIPEFAPPPDYASLEFPGFDPYTGAVLHFANENFLQAITLGGVFERFPRLRFGVIEVGASWVGPLAERLDAWCEVYPRQAAKVLNRRPSEYLNQNVRVSPFYFEDVRTYFERYPQVADVYAFASDYPHVEGGKETKSKMAEQLAPLGHEILTKFFTTNGDWLLPD